MSARDQMLDWLEQGLVDRARTREALRVCGVYPTNAQWALFVDRLLLGLGMALMLSGVVSFFAANWSEIGRFGRILLLDVLVLITLGAVWRLGLESLAGRAALFAATVLVGVLLAVIGQVYQTGADAYELFAVWALMTLPWVVLGRFVLLWLFWLGLINLAAYLYYDTFHGLLGILLEPRQALLVNLLFNGLALLVLELVATRGVVWLQARWPMRILATAGGVPATLLAVLGILGGKVDPGLLDVMIWLIWIGALFLVYRYLRVDVFMLAGGLLSLIVVVVVGLWRLLSNSGSDAMILLLISVVIVALSSAGGWWMTQIANGKRQ